MASVARVLFDAFLLFNLIFDFDADAHYPPVYPKQIELSDHWEKNSITYQDKHITEVIIKQGVSRVRLVCKIDPPLPTTEEHFRLRDSLVRFEKIYPEHYVLTGSRYWSDSLHITAVALDVSTVDLFGTYACFYGEMKKTVDILAESEEIVQNLPAPVTLENMMSTAFVKKSFTENIQLPNTTTFPVIGKKNLNCVVKESRSRTKSVHRLSPSDIRVVASLGDSILIGLGARATTKAHFFTENRGLSWSNGGDSTFEEVLTMPNLIKRFNPQLRGYSTSIARHYENNSGFNLATVSSVSRDLEDQAHQLISKVKKDKNVDFQKDWKLVTIMSGTRDLCRLRVDEDEITPDDYIQSLVKTLDILQSKMPKTFVNFILPLNVSSLYSLTAHGNCMIGNWSICPCLKDEFMRRKISNFYEGYKSLVYELIDSGVYDGSDDFTVVVQPVFESLTFDVQDRDLFSLDCLHFSAKGNALAAMALWKNMFEPINMKYSRWRGQHSINCSTEESPYFSTKVNSKTEAKTDRILDSENGMSPGIYVAVTMAILFALALIAAFIYLKHKLRTPITKLKFSNKPWIKYSI